MCVEKLNAETVASRRRSAPGRDFLLVYLFLAVALAWLTSIQHVAQQYLKLL